MQIEPDTLKLFSIIHNLTTLSKKQFVPFSKYDIHQGMTLYDGFVRPAIETDVIVYDDRITDPSDTSKSYLIISRFDDKSRLYEKPIVSELNYGYNEKEVNMGVTIDDDHSYIYMEVKCKDDTELDIIIENGNWNCGGWQ